MEKETKEIAKDILLFQVHKQVKSLFVSFLEIIEDLQADGYVFSEDKRVNLRKRVLSNGNNTIRNLEQLLEKLDIGFKQ